MSEAKIYEYTEENVQMLARKLWDGQLVAFPTETVFGLGANAYNVEAVLNIFKVKKRPLTDPLIVHVSNWEQVCDLVDLSEFMVRNQSGEYYVDLIQKFAKDVWPGPVTMVFKAKDKVPREITAGTDTIGVRIPDHKTALHLLEVCQLPIAAPSANLFSHVSPTRASHVYDDFKDQDISILNGTDPVYGIESTIIKFGMGKVDVYRLGSLTIDDLKYSLSRNKLNNLEVVVHEKRIKEDEECNAPGQYIKHYSPNLPTYIFGDFSNDDKVEKITMEELSRSVIVDLNFELEFLDKHCKHSFFDFYKTIKNAGEKLYLFLREAEKIPDVDRILISNMSDLKDEGVYNYFDEDRLPAIVDKINRATCGKKLSIPFKPE